MGRSPYWVLAASLALVACEPANPPQESPEPGAITAKVEPAPSPQPVGFDFEIDEQFAQEALALGPEELMRLRDVAIADGGSDLRTYLMILWVRGDVAATRAMREPLLALGDGESFALYAELMLDLALGEPHLLYELAADAHAAGFVETLTMLAELAQHDVFAVDPYDRVRVGELLRSMDPGTSFRAALVLARLHTDGAPELRIEAVSARATELFEADALAGTAEQTLEIAAAFQAGEHAPKDVRRAQQLFALAGDKGAAGGHNDSAWLATTCAGFTQSEHAQALAQVEQDIAEHGAAAINVDTLAAVYARLGRYDEAVAAQVRATRMLEQEDPDNAERRAGFDARLALFRSGRPYDGPDC